MPPRYAEPEEELEAPKRVFFSMIGSAAFRWSLGLISLIAIALLGIGAESWATAAASKNTDLVGAVADVAVLKTEYKDIKAVADNHTFQLNQAVSDRAQAAIVQGRIFDAIKQLSNDVQTLSVNVGKVDTKVDDLKEQVQRR